MLEKLVSNDDVKYCLKINIHDQLTESQHHKSTIGKNIWVQIHTYILCQILCRLKQVCKTLNLKFLSYTWYNIHFKIQHIKTIIVQSQMFTSQTQPKCFCTCHQQKANTSYSKVSLFFHIKQTKNFIMKHQNIDQKVTSHSPQQNKNNTHQTKYQTLHFF